MITAAYEVGAFFRLSPLKTQIIFYMTPLALTASGVMW